MMNIGVEKGLTNVADYLSKKGYGVQIISESMKNDSSEYLGFDAVVVADYNTDMLGYQDTETKARVINASGLTAEEVEDLIKRQASK